MNLADSPTLSWYLRSRLYGGILAFAVALGAQVLFAVPLPEQLIYPLLAFIPLSHLAFQHSGAAAYKEPTKIVAPLLVFDTLLLTALLAFSGGASNPFSIMFLVQVLLAVLFLGRSWAMGIALLSSLAFAALFLVPSDHSAHGSHSGFDTHLMGMFFAYVLISVLVAYYFSRLVSMLRRRDEELQQLRARERSLAAVGSLTATAAHELSTPLATIHLVASELKDELHKGQPHYEDAQTVLEESERCKRILDSLCVGTGKARFEELEEFELAELAQLACEEFPNLKVSYSPNAEAHCYLPLGRLSQAMRAIISNAVHASGAESVHFELKTHENELRLIVSDQGPGIPEEIRAKVLEPFFTTKADMGGMGLGLYSAQLVALSLGGELLIRETVGGGAQVEIQVPRFLHSQKSVVGA